MELDVVLEGVEGFVAEEAADVVEVGVAPDQFAGATALATPADVVGELYRGRPCFRDNTVRTHPRNDSQKIRV